MRMNTAAGRAVREYAVRYRWPGDSEYRLTSSGDLPAAVDEFEDLTGRGVVAADIVARDVPVWHVADEALPVMVRALADAQVDDQVDYGTIRNRLAEWLRTDPTNVMQAWRRLFHAIDTYRRADDGVVDWQSVPRELREPEVYVRHCEQLVDEAVSRVIAAGSR